MIEQQPPMDPNEPTPGAGAPPSENTTPPERPQPVMPDAEPGERQPRQERQQRPPDPVQQAIADLLSDPAFIEQMLKGDPDFNGPGMAKAKRLIEEQIRSVDREAQGYAELFFDNLKRIVADRIGQEQNATTRKEMAKHALENERTLFEEAIEVMISVADDSPEVDYRKVFQPTFQQSEYIASLKELSKIFDEPGSSHPHEFSEYIRELILIRSEAHNLRLSIKYGKQFQEEILQFNTHAMQFLQDDIVGLPEVVRLYERAAAARVSIAGSWFTAEDEKAIQGQVRESFRKLAGVNERGENVGGRPLVTKEGRRLADWEVSRALRMGENMFYSTQRMAVYAGIGNLPSIANIEERIASLPGGEYVVRTIYAAKISARFAAGNDTAEFFWDKIYRELVAGSYTPGRSLKDLFTGEVQEPPEKDPKEPSVFGLEKRTLWLNALGAADIESQSWRSTMMFLGTIRFADGTSLLEVLRREGENALNTVGYASAAEKNLDERRDPILGGGDLTPKGKEALAKQVREQVLGQRLYLSILARQPTFLTKNEDKSLGLKGLLWEKMALLNPSSIASLLPDIVKGNGAWDGLRAKLWLAEEARVRRDTEKYKAGLSPTDLQRETQDFMRIRTIAAKAHWSDAEFQQILSYMGMSDILSGNGEHKLTAGERGLLQKIVYTGIKDAAKLSDAKMPHALCITDTPIISWEKTKDGKAGVATEDFIRLYTGDQVSFGEGWQAVGGFVADPVKGDFVKSMQTGVQKIGGVIGNDGGQLAVEPFVTAWLKFVSDKHPYTSSGRKAFRFPRSEFEKFNRGTFYALSDHQRHGVIDALVQAGVLSDNIEAARAAGTLTMADRVRRKVAADLYARILATARFFALLFGVEFANSFLKVALPDDVGKALGIK